MPLVGAEECEAVDRVLRSGRLVQGEEVEAFEAEFSALVGGRECVAVNSGTAALHLALLAAGIGPGDEVIVPSFTFAATANAVRLAGATPVFVDIEARTFCVDPDAVRAAITPRTAAVIPVHLFGHPAAVDELRPLCERRALLLLEDAAQAHAASLHGTPAGAWGDMAAFSFYPTKNMTTGEGGLVVASDAQHLRRLRLLRNQGMERRYHNEIVGFNARLTEMGAAIGRVQLTKLAGWTRRRQANAARYDEELTGVDVPQVSTGAVHVYHQYTVRAADRDGLLARLTAAGVEAGVYYPVPVHRLPSFQDPVDLPVTSRACAEVLSLPIGPHLSDEDLDVVIRAVGA
ncbi:MAG: DegT/DnrJ/EryC1/StrS family aminotransferase [Actinomycetota bacterium]|nr:DegT/DnrJ/EryC1/StrS family aminotransferase [Actinomycetota bacterium]